MAANLNYRIEEASTPDDTKIVYMSGEIDESNQPELERMFQELLNDEELQHIILNIKDLDFINSCIIGIFVSFHGSLVENDKSIVFAEANDNIFDIIDLVGLTSVIEHFATNQEACLSFED